MKLELTEQQRQAVRERPDSMPAEVVDPDSHREYLLVARSRYEELQSTAKSAHRAKAGIPLVDESEGIPPGIRRSQEAFWRDLPALFAQKKLRGKWVCYAGDERIGIAPTQHVLILECRRRGLPDVEYHTDVIRLRDLAPWQIEEIECRGEHFAHSDQDELS